MANGVVTRLIRDRGFGFVRGENGRDILFHVSELPPGVFDTLAEGQQLEFESEIDSRGRGERATHVRLASS